VKTKPQLSDQLCWDIDIKILSFEDSSDWVIERVFDRGSLPEVFEVIKYYGREKVKDYLQNTPNYLPNHSILLAKAIFELQLKNFKCLEKRPFLPNY
jgi:cyclopropane fatty-acyl-phospholipid synthase-like methyltransferase